MQKENTIHIERVFGGISIRGWRGAIETRTEADGLTVHRFWRPGGGVGPALIIRADPSGSICEVQAELPPEAQDDTP